MTRLNLVEASLLNLSGELGPKARGELLDHLDKNAAAQAKYDGIAADYATLSAMPLPTLGEADRARIIGRLKRAVQVQVAARRRELAADRRHRIVHYALAALSAAAAVVVLAIGVGLMNSTPPAQNEQVARLNRTIDRMAAADDRPTAYDQALADVDSSIREMQAEGPSMAAAQSDEMAPLLDALASIPATSTTSDVMFDVPMGGM